MATKLDPFTQKRIVRWIETYRSSQGELPTLQDFEKGGFSRDQVDAAIKVELIEEFYVTLTSGTIMKGYKVKQR